MYQALFSGDDKWASVIIPFHKFLFTSRGMLVEQQQNLDTRKIATIGFLQAERKEGEFCIQLESINAISLQAMKKETRYDPDSTELFSETNLEDEKDENFDYVSPTKPKDYYSNVFRY